MFNVGDYVVNQKTGYEGKVIGYGHQIRKSGYTTTLKVLVDESRTSSQRVIVVEELYSTWVPYQGQSTPSLTEGEN